MSHEALQHAHAARHVARGLDPCVFGAHRGAVAVVDGGVLRQHREIEIEEQQRVGVRHRGGVVLGRAHHRGDAGHVGLGPRQRAQLDAREFGRTRFVVVAVRVVDRVVEPDRGLDQARRARERVPVCKPTPQRLDVCERVVMTLRLGIHRLEPGAQRRRPLEMRGEGHGLQQRRAPSARRPVSRNRPRRPSRCR